MSSPPRPWRRWRLALLALLAVLATSACEPFGLPGDYSPQAHRVRNLWTGSWVAAFVIGVFVWGMIAITVVRDRKRGDEMPRQVAYNVPIEVLYTVVPFVIVGALFYYTARDEIYVQKTTAQPAAHGVTVVDVEAFQWGWTFRYLNDSAKAGVPQGEAVFVTGSSNTTEPTLVLPSGTPIQFQEHSDNVMHSFWIPALLFKEDVVPGRTNVWEVSKITREGTFRGHCALLCGYDHARMNFNVKVVSPTDYQQFLRQQVTDGHQAAVPDWVLQQTPVGSFS